MKIIAHRGNKYGKDNRENNPSFIEGAIKDGFDVEVDIWYEGENKWWLGHDKPDYKIKYDFLYEHRRELWIHCKDIDTFLKFVDSIYKLDKFNCFMHEQDPVALTLQGFLWTYKSTKLTASSIAVMPEQGNLWSIGDLKKCYGICTDYPVYWRRILTGR